MHMTSYPSPLLVAEACCYCSGSCAHSFPVCRISTVKATLEEVLPPDSASYVFDKIGSIATYASSYNCLLSMFVVSCLLVQRAARGAMVSWARCHVASFETGVVRTFFQMEDRWPFHTSMQNGQRCWMGEAHVPALIKKTIYTTR